jgi:outer membrane protein OmpA-like peptidoglycan-associated protein
MKNRIASARWRSRRKPPRAAASAEELIPEGQVRAGRIQAPHAEIWRAREAANSSEFFNWFVFGCHHGLEADTPAFVEEWIFFSAQEWKLGAGARATLLQQLPLLRENRGMRIVIGGIASHPGSIAQGMRLGLRRVLSIRTCLLAHGIDAARIGIAIRGKGWSLTECPAGPDEPDSPHGECRLQVVDAHWAPARN